jgi:hypothetical protein
MIDRENSEGEDDVAKLPTANRFSVTLVPTVEFSRWARSCFEDERETTHADVKREPTAYLYPLDPAGGQASPQRGPSVRPTTRH